MEELLLPEGSLRSAFLRLAPLAPIREGASAEEKRRIIEVNSGRREAARQVLKELQRISPGVTARTGRPLQEIEDAVQTTIFNLLRNSIPRQASDFQNDGAVRGYLSRALEYNLITMIRRARTEPDVPLENQGGVPDVPGARLDLDSAHEWLWGEIVPALAEARRGPRSRERFLVSVGQLRELAEGHTSMEQIIDGEMHAPSAGSPAEDDGVQRKRVADRLYKRFGRVLVDLEQECARFSKRRGMTPEETGYIRMLIDLMRPTLNRSRRHES